MTLSAVIDQLTLAREHALLGSYDAALIYFEGVLVQLDKCVYRGKISCSQ